MSANEPASRHTLHVNLVYGVGQLSFTCESPPGAECRLICADLDCLHAGWTDADEDEDGHQHEMRDNGGCVILDWDDLAENGPGEQIPLHDGTPVQFRWDGDCWRWDLA